MYDDSFFGTLKRGYFSIPIAIRTVMTISGIFFILTFFPLIGMGQWIVNIFGFYSEPLTAFTQPWRFVTYIYVHGGLIHILFNMLILWWIGRVVEEDLGPRNFSVLFYGAGIGGVLIDLIIRVSFGMPAMPIVGASGGVMGILVCFAVMYPRRKIFLWLLIPIEARFLVVGLILVDFLLLGGQDNVAREVHLGGAATGFLLMKMYQNGYHYDLWIESIMRTFGKKRKAKSTSTGAAGKTRKGSMHAVSDAEVVSEEKQNELDRILEKISKKGYDGLTDEEKKILFELSKRN